MTLLVGAAVAVALASCGGEESAREVVLYYSADDYVARPIVEAFEQKTGIRVRAAGDTEATKTTGLVQRLRVERKRPRADVLWSSEVFMTIQLAREGLLAAHESATMKELPARLHGAGHRWHGFGQRARVVVYNTERVSPEEAPGNMTELLNPRFAGRIVMARPDFGTTRGHMAALVAIWGAENARAFLEGLRENGVRLVDGNASVVRAVAAGEADVGLTDTDDVWAGRRNGWPIDLVYVRHDLPASASHGVMVIPNTVAVIAGGPNPKEAALLADFLASPEVERALAESDSRNIPARAEVAREFGELLVDDAIETPLGRVTDAMDEAMRVCDETLGG